MKSYHLNHENEFDRLERQSSEAPYDYRAELREFMSCIGKSVLDAGCGSGVVSRYLASMRPEATVLGIDGYAERIEQAQRFAATQFPNLRFQTDDLSKLQLDAGVVDTVICRFVLQHLTASVRADVLRELFRVSQAGGHICMIDTDGFLFNVFPQSQKVSEGLRKFAAEPSLDLWVGRKLPSLLAEAGFIDVKWRVEVMEFQSDALLRETHLFEDRFSQIQPFLETLMGSSNSADEFVREFLDLLRHPQTVLFYNKFIVTGRKPDAKGLRVVKS